MFDTDSAITQIYRVSAFDADSAITQIYGVSAFDADSANISTSFRGWLVPVDNATIHIIYKLLMLVFDTNRAIIHIFHSLVFGQCHHPHHSQVVSVFSRQHHHPHHSQAVLYS